MLANFCSTICILMYFQVVLAEKLSLSGKSNNTVILKHYGENCSELEECNIKETLACVNGTCKCPDSNTMIFDQTRGLCVGKAGHRCVVHSSEKSVSPTRRNPCVMYASCESNEGSKNSTCQCWSSFYPEQDTGLCARKRDYLQKCERDEFCNSRKGFVCNKDMGICTCDTNTTSYNADKERCVGLPNQECVNVYRECIENHSCKGGVCRCKFKEVESANGTSLCDPVRHKFGKMCGRYRGDCGDEKMNNLRCLDGKCRCKNPDYQIYDYDRRICVSKVGGPCGSFNTSKEIFRNGTNNSKFNPDTFPVIQCISYAHCVPITFTKKSNYNIPPSEIPKGICECGETFIETKKGMCNLPFASECDTTSKNKKDQCAEPLKCVDSFCNCQNDADIFEPETNKCAKTIKSLCWKDSSCVKNAICKQKSKKLLPGRCKCMQKFRPTPLGTCV